MCRYFYGNLEEMMKLWQAARDFELDTYGLEERCLMQFLYTEEFSANLEKIFESYGENMGREILVLACLSCTYNSKFAHCICPAKTRCGTVPVKIHPALPPPLAPPSDG